jgi:hypothetical protein
MRESRLAPGADLRPNRDNPNHLLGRDKDVSTLTDLCRDFSLVHLVGEAGAGKTALVRAGLVPALRTGGQIVPVYVNIYGQDWVKGPLCSLAESLWEMLSEEQRQKLGMTGRHDPDRVTNHLTNFRQTIGLLPLLIFDQFDDYQLRHSARFLDEKRKTWIAPGQLTRVNSFWREVKQLIKDDLAHALFVTRADNADGLASIQFTEPQVYRLTRLPAHVARDILTRIMAPAEGAAPVVIDPEYGWEKLRERLARDLDEAGTAFPMRIKLTLLGLPRLRALTVSAYERYGGLPALEAGYIEGHIREAARASGGLSEEDLRRLLLRMTDQEALKTTARTEDELHNEESRHDRAE